MEMTLSTIIDLRFFLRRWDLPPGVNDSVGRLIFFRYGSSDLVSPDQSWIVSHGCREEYYPRNSRMLRPQQWWFVLLAPQQRRPGCSVTFPWYTGVGTLVDGD
jgi:hypothetical protein